ncbi:MAG TPA: hypothetical protein VL947_02785, partial [Cytophagales bacterium]|nr:hypothetical protein [Cytophagales bacterium]
MRLLIQIFAAAALMLLLSNFLFFKPKWQPLLDKDLSQWETYLSYRHKVGYKGEMPTDSSGKPIPPIGYVKNGSQVFSMIEEQGVPVLKVTGEIYGCIFTKRAYENYHLKLQVRWG